MLPSQQLKPLELSDHMAVREVYIDAIQSQCATLYTKEQIRQWSALAFLPGVLDSPLKEGRGWISLENQNIAAFAVRYPLNRLALLYCRGHFSRRGHATVLLNRVEQEALDEGIDHLVTEASFVSYELLLRRGWRLIRPNTFEIGGVSFRRYLMEKILIQ